ncbi:hypothetical protein JHD50_13410 [Sulfurimonas sp. MAG313]|nr:hypothetical protein [Sulfurimonas sp. MAG313]MDF1882286.1 hypothetical protein [Sulfurimonas sp. MAG313]
MFTLAKNSLAFEVKDKVYGLQDKGISPQGASDQLSFEIAKVLLGQPKEFLCVEIMFSSKISFIKDCAFTLTGAHYEKTLLHSKNTVTSLNHSCVYIAKKGDFLSLHHLKKGFRLYLMSSLEEESFKRLGVCRGEFSKHFSSPTRSHISLLKGPEYHYLKQASSFFKNTYTISNDSNLIGLRLESQQIQSDKYDIISSCVGDGTVQLTNKGPIVLLRHRQTTGGYPRIFCVIAADLDTLAQYPIGANVHFKLINMNEAKALLIEKEKEFKDFKHLMQS